jgi:hypothetical protein
MPKARFNLNEMLRLASYIKQARKLECLSEGGPYDDYIEYLGFDHYSARLPGMALVGRLREPSVAEARLRGIPRHEYPGDFFARELEISKALASKMLNASESFSADEFIASLEQAIL